MDHWSWVPQVKGKVCHTPKQHRQGVHLPLQGCEHIGGNTTSVCDARPAVIFPAYDGTKLILLGDRLVYVNNRVGFNSMVGGISTCGLLTASPPFGHRATQSISPESKVIKT